MFRWNMFRVRCEHSYSVMDLRSLWSESISQANGWTFFTVSPPNSSHGNSCCLFPVLYCSARCSLNFFITRHRRKPVRIKLGTACTSVWLVMSADHSYFLERKIHFNYVLTLNYTEISPCFKNAFGVANRNIIPYNRMTASTYFSSGYKPAYGRLNFKTVTNQWITGPVFQE